MIDDQSLRSRFDSATDTATMSGRLCRELGGKSSSAVEFSALEIPRVFAHVSGEFVIQYRLWTTQSKSGTASPLILWGKLFSDPEQARKYASIDPESMLLLDDLRLVVPIFPFDPALPILRVIASPSTWSEELRNRLVKCAVSQTKGELLAVELLAYRLERRAALKLTLADTHDRGRTTAIVAKAMLPRKAKRFGERHASLMRAMLETGAQERMKIPVIYDANSDDGLVCMEFATGKTVHELIGSGSEFVAGCGEAGQLLSALHSLPAADLPRHTAPMELQQLRALADGVGAVRPSLVDSVREEIDVADSQLACLTESAPVRLHMDFYDKQVLSGGGQATLIDFENMALGDAARDVGNFLAHLDFRSAQMPQYSSEIDHGKDRFLEGYSCQEVSLGDVNWWRRVAAIRLTLLYSLRPRWSALAESLIGTIDSGQVEKH